MTEGPSSHVLSALITSSPCDATAPVLEEFVEICYGAGKAWYSQYENQQVSFIE